jgi:hypothetical protein
VPEMTLEEFALFVQRKDQQLIHKYYDSHLALYYLLSKNFSNDDKMSINFVEDKTGCHYNLSSPTLNLFEFKNFYDETTITLCFHNYISKVKINKNNTITIKFIDTGV